jgi:inhibitor of KinA
MMEFNEPYKCYPIGNQAITLEFAQEINEEINDRVMSLFYWIQEEQLPGIKDIIPAYASISLVYDAQIIRKYSPKTTPYQYVRTFLLNAVKQLDLPQIKSCRNIKIPTCYHENLGPDLAFVSEEKKLSISQIIQIHTTTIYRVYMIGFLPGFAYMGKVDERIVVKRKPSPRNAVAAGSVGIAGAQTGIYPFESPGGWQLIGQTPIPLFNPAASSPTYFEPGDSVQFVSISLDDFYQIKNNPARWVSVF